MKKKILFLLLPLLLSSLPGHAVLKEKDLKETLALLREELTSYYKDLQRLKKAMVSLYQKQIISLVAKGLSGAILTQLSDVEQETNGLVTYDRKVMKIEAKTMRSLNQALRFGEATPGE